MEIVWFVSLFILFNRSDHVITPMIRNDIGTERIFRNVSFSAIYSNWILLHWATCVRVFFFVAFGCIMRYCYVFCVLYCVMSWKMENLCQTVSNLTSPIILNNNNNKVKLNERCSVHGSSTAGLWVCMWVCVQLQS